MASVRNTNPPIPAGQPRPGRHSAKPDPFVGRTIGNCEIREKISEGGTAYIYRAYNTRFELDRVVKILKPSLTDEMDFYLRFTQEAQLTARLDHPNILRVFDTGEADGHFYIEMEYIQGITLRQMIASHNRINEREILRIVSQLLKALDYAHNIKVEAPGGEVISGILHRDIKPENIMITADKVVKLMDFGAAKPLNITSNTMQGMIVGTFHYMSPEQLDGSNLDARSDFFSLGIVLYELFTGQKPFSAEKLTALIQRIKRCKYPPTRKVRASISPMSEELIDRLLSRDRKHRPRSAKEIDESVQIALQTLNAWGSGRRVRVPFSFRRTFPVLSLIVSLAALGISIYAVMRAPPWTAQRQAATGEGPRVSPLDRGRELERQRLWSAAMNMYELVPSVENGGVANEFLEGQIRLARICFAHLNQFTKARSILESLRNNFSDPAIDAYLGEIYFRLALYNEARVRLDIAVNSKKGSVIPQTEEFRAELLYYYAASLDRQYIYVDQSPAILMDAIKAWQYYAEFAECGRKRKDKECSFAHKRLAELEQIGRDLKNGK